MTAGRVIFATTVFGEVATGPATYARYLWEAFRDDPDIEFHMVAPKFPFSHNRLHVSEPCGTGSRNLYRSVASKALSLASADPAKTIIHGNTAHQMFDMVNYKGLWIVQINDYEAAQAWSLVLPNVARYGPRRVLSLLWRHRQEGLAVHRATKVICNSAFTRREVIKAYAPPNPERIASVYKAVDLSLFSHPSPSTEGPLPKRPTGGRLVFVGTNWRRKGLRDLLEAMPRIAKRVPNVTLIVVGPSETESLKPLRKIAKTLQCEDRIFFVGRVSRQFLPTIFSHCDAMVMPTYSEALGVAILEAMAAGLPVISCSVGGIPEIVDNGRSGVLVPRGDIDALANKTADVLTNHTSRRSLAAHGRRRAADFSVGRMTSRIKEIYLESLNGMTS